jgi:hypothetical protein
MADVDSEVPERIEQAFGQCSHEWVIRVVAEEHDVDVAV